MLHFYASKGYTQGGVQKSLFGQRGGKKYPWKTPLHFCPKIDFWPFWGGTPVFGCFGGSSREPLEEGGVRPRNR